MSSVAAAAMLVFSRLLFTLRTPLPYIALNGKLKASLISVFNTNILFHSSSTAAAHTLDGAAATALMAAALRSHTLSKRRFTWTLSLLNLCPPSHFNRTSRQ